MTTTTKSQEMRDTRATEAPEMQQSATGAKGVFVSSLPLSMIKEAQERLQAFELTPTPLVHSLVLSERLGAHVYLKCENLQWTGSYKVRGASNKMLSLRSEERQRKVVTASAGNHAQGVALAARKLGIHAHIVMPIKTPQNKVDAVRAYGDTGFVTVEKYGKDYDEAHAYVLELVKQKKWVEVHAFNDLSVIAGQATVAMEVVAQCPRLPDMVFVPVGGGGLFSSTVTVFQHLHPNANVQVVPVIHATGDTLAVSLREKRATQGTDSTTRLAEGTKVRKMGNLAFDLVSHYSENDVVKVSEDQVARAMLFALEKQRLIVEGAGALSLAALLAMEDDPRQKAALKGKTIVLILSGGNVDTTRLDQVIHHGLLRSDRLATFEVVLRDEPGQLEKALHLLQEEGLNIVGLDLDFASAGTQVHEARVRFKVQSRDRQHFEEAEAKVLILVREEGWVYHRTSGGML
jgi:threonine dehydratase